MTKDTLDYINELYRNMEDAEDVKDVLVNLSDDCKIGDEFRIGSIRCKSSVGYDCNETSHYISMCATIPEDLRMELIQVCQAYITKMKTMFKNIKVDGNAHFQTTEEE